MKLRFLTAVAVVGMAGSLFAADAPTRVLVLARRDWLMQQVGKYDPAHGWIRSDTYFDRPLQGTAYTLFGLAGKMAEVKTIDTMRLYQDGVPWVWEAHISLWPWPKQEIALGIQGSWPAPPRVASPLPLDDASLTLAVADFLKSKSLDVPQPLLTQALAVDLLNDGRTEEIVCAHSDEDVLVDTEAAKIYAVALVVFQEDGKTKTLPLDAYTAYKPANRNLDTQAHLYGLRPVYNIIAFPDIFGDGHLEVAFTKTMGDLPQAQLDSFDGKTLKTQIASYIIER